VLRVYKWVVVHLKKRSLTLKYLHEPHHLIGGLPKQNIVEETATDDNIRHKGYVEICNVE
jgi:hypothetical protein